MSSKIVPVARNMVYQTGTIRSLLRGIYDGDMTFAELAHYGDFGLGTFNEVSGEMVALDGHFYRVDSAGKVFPVAPGAQTPFSIITRFGDAPAFALRDVNTFEQMENLVENRFESRNLIYAIRVDGIFAVVKVRSEHHQPHPYRPLAESIGELQTEFEHHNVAGSLVGFWFPGYMSSINVTGFHFHFIDEARRMGGHLFQIAFKQAEARIHSAHDFGMHLIHTRLFETTDLSEDDSEAVRIVEKPK